MNKRSLLLVTGFMLFVISVIGFILNLIGVSLSIFKPIDDQGYLIATIVKAILFTTGLCMVYYAQMIKTKY